MLASVDDGELLTVESGQWVEIEGKAFDDLNGNRHHDFGQSDGRLGWVIHADDTRLEWTGQSLSSVIDWNQTDYVHRGSSAIATTIDGNGDGIQFTFVAAESLAQTDLESLRFAARTDGVTGVTARLRLVGTNGAASVLVGSIADQSWQTHEIALAPTFSDIGEIQRVQVTFVSAASHSYDVYLDSVVLLGDVAATAPSPVDKPPNWGTNLFFHEDYTSDAAFANVTRTLRRWGQLDEPWRDDPQLTYTDQGIPLSPAAAVMYLRGYVPGIYQLRYEGTGSISFRMGQGQPGSIGIVSGTRRTEGTETVAEVEITETGVLMILRIDAIDVADPIRDLQLLAPRYHGPDAPTYRDEFLDRLQPFSTLRFMDYTVTNNSTVTDWAARRLPTDTIQTSQLTSGDRGGVAWELLIEMANAAQVDAWINVPHLADDTYVSHLAQLWLDQLDPNLKLIVEYSNEIWNPAFLQYSDTNQADYQNVIGPKLVELRQTFDAVWNAPGVEQGDRVEFVLAGQSANPYPIARAIESIQTFVDGNADDAYHRINDVIGALAIAMYANVDATTIYTNLNDTLASLLDMDEQRAYAATLQNIAHQYSLKMYGYEAGQHLRTSQTSYPGLVRLAQLDPRMADVQARLSEVWQSFGGDLFMHYTFTGESGSTSQWGLLESLDLPGSVRWDSAMSLLRTPGDADLNGVVDFDDFLILQQHFNQSDRWWEAGDFNADQRVDDNDLALFWLHLDPSELDADQLAAIDDFAVAQSAALPKESLNVSISSHEIHESTTPDAPTLAHAATLTIQRTGDLSEHATVRLSVDDESELSVDASTVTIPAGQSSVIVPVRAINDGVIDGSQLAKIQARGEGYSGDSIHLVVADTGAGEREPTLAATLVFLDKNDNGAWEAGEPVAETGADGRFRFEWVPTGSYRVVVREGTGSAAARLDVSSMRIVDAFGQAAVDTQAGSIGVVDDSGSINARGALQFDGDGDRVDLSAPEHLALGSTSVRSVSLWFYALDVHHRQVIYEEGDSTTGLNVYLDSGELHVGGWSRAPTPLDADWSGTWHAAPVDPNQWYHVVLVVDGSKMIHSSGFRSYLDGSMIAAGEATQLRNRQNIISLGAANSDTRYASLPEMTHDLGGNGLIGYIDEVELFDRALSPVEIVQLSQQPTLVGPVTPSGPIVYASLSDPIAAEPDDVAQFVVTMTSMSDWDTVVDYTVSGTAQLGSDVALSVNSVTIPANQSVATVDLSIVDDQIMEVSESLTLLVTSAVSHGVPLTVGERNGGTLTIDDDDVAVVSAAAQEPVATESSQNGQIVIRMSQPSDSDTVVAYSITGDATPGIDYQKLSGSAQLLAGETSVLIDVIAWDDSVAEPPEMVTLTLSPQLISGNPRAQVQTNPVTISIVDQNSVPEITDQMFQVDENSPNTTLVGTIDATDPDFDETLTYAATGGTGMDVFHVDSDTGRIIVADGSHLDYETQADYTLTVDVTDSAEATASATIEIKLVNQAEANVVGRRIFYNNSAYDDYEIGASPQDDAAIAPSPAELSDATLGKAALLPGQSAGIQHYTNYSKGINGIMVDVAGLPNHAAIAANDFVFKLGNDSNLAGWSPAPNPSSVSLRTGAGQDGSDRITIIWPDGAITNTWLSVRLLATDTTDLPDDDLFYFGNLIGDMGHSADRAVTDQADTQRGFRSLFSSVSIETPNDVDRDGQVGFGDIQHIDTHLFQSIELINVPPNPLPAVAEVWTASQHSAIERTKKRSDVSTAESPLPPRLGPGIGKLQVWIGG